MSMRNPKMRSDMESGRPLDAGMNFSGRASSGIIASIVIGGCPKS